MLCAFFGRVDRVLSHSRTAGQAPWAGLLPAGGLGQSRERYRPPSIAAALPECAGERKARFCQVHRIGLVPFADADGLGRVATFERGHP